MSASGKIFVAVVVLFYFIFTVAFKDFEGINSKLGNNTENFPEHGIGISLEFISLPYLLSKRAPAAPLSCMWLALTWIKEHRSLSDPTDLPKDQFGFFLVSLKPMRLFLFPKSCEGLSGSFVHLPEILIDS